MGKHMNKQEVIARYKELLDELEEDAQDVVLSAGAALVMMGIREETADLDVDVGKGTFNYIARSMNKKVVTSQIANDLLEYDETVDLHVRDENVGVVQIDGVWVYSPSSMLVQKRYLASSPHRKPGKAEQDLEDIAALEAVMKEQKFSAKVMA